ncbi:MAG: porin family protein [Fimbriimonadaceae bacterium]|nr:porin family protein [Alphaproteobacteria bacterium]
MRKSVCVLPAFAALVLASPSNAADVPIYEVVSDDSVLGEIISSWDGFFVGINSGYVNQKNRASFAGGLRPTFDANGFIGGGQIGYNYQIGNWVLGAEADFMYMNADGAIGIPAGTFTTQTDWLSTVRGRVGIASNGYLFYLTGGAAFSEIKTNYLGASNSESAVGWTAGAGLEMAVGNNIAVRGEYLYANFGDQTNTYAAVPVTYRSEMHIFRAGLNYRFN